MSKNTTIYRETQNRIDRFYAWMDTLKETQKHILNDLKEIGQRNRRDRTGLDFLSKHPKRKNTSSR